MLRQLTPRLQRVPRFQCAPLPSCTNGIVSRTERDVSADRSATLVLGFDRKRTVQQFESLLHADEAKPSGLLRRFTVKADTRVANREMNLV
jgi:hypothetical protein